MSSEQADAYDSAGPQGLSKMHSNPQYTITMITFVVVVNIIFTLLLLTL